MSNWSMCATEVVNIKKLDNICDESLIVTIIILRDPIDIIENWELKLYNCDDQKCN